MGSYFLSVSWLFFPFFYIYISYIFEGVSVVSYIVFVSSLY